MTPAQIAEKHDELIPALDDAETQEEIDRIYDQLFWLEMAFCYHPDREPVVDP